MSREPAARRLSAAFFAATLALLAALRVRPAVHLDTARDLLLARDCVLAGRCGAGPRASFGEWTQGALWSHLLELRELLGLGLAALEHAAIVAVALAAALVPLTARALGRRATALTWALWLPATLLTIGWPTLWNPTLWPLVLAAFHLALLHAARTRGVLAFTAAAAALALAIDVHVASAVLVPFFGAALVARAARPLSTACLAALVAIAALAVDSPAAFADNRELVTRHALSIVLVLAAAAAVGLAARRRLVDDSPARVARALCIYLIITLPLLSFVAGHPLHARYLAPLVTPLAVLLGRRDVKWPAVLACAAYLAFWLDDRWYNHRFRLHETEPIAAAMYGRGLGFGDLYQHLRGPHAYDLLSTLAALEPPGHRGAADGLDLLVFRTSHQELPAELPPDWTVVDLGSHVAVLVAYEPRIRTDRFTACRTTDAERCTSITLDRDRFTDAPWTDRAHAAIPDLARPARGERLVYRFPLSPGEPRRVHLFADECKGWTIGNPDALASPAAGELVFTVETTSRCRGWLPPFVELPVASSPLDRALRE